MLECISPRKVTSTAKIKNPNVNDTDAACELYKSARKCKYTTGTAVRSEMVLQDLVSERLARLFESAGPTQKQY